MFVYFKKMIMKMIVKLIILAILIFGLNTYINYKVKKVVEEFKEEQIMKVENAGSKFESFFNKKGVED